MTDANTPTILRKIVARKHQEILERQELVPESALRASLVQAPPVRGFVAAIERSLEAGRSAVIAEIKKASPSKGIIRADFDPAAIAQSYASAGATCLSVLTDVEFFQGADIYLQQARHACELPVLRKDFMVAPYQILESRAMGADCILLIAASLSLTQMQDLAQLAQDCGLDVLVEVHNGEELEQALQLNTRLIGINNRDLHSFDVSLNTTFELLKQVPKDRIIVTESGIHTPEDVKAMRQHGVDSFLVGESFMRADDPGAKLKELFFS